MKAIVTIPPYAPFIKEVLKHPAVSGLRLNTVMPIKGSLEDTLKRLNEHTSSKGKDLWIDLKCRQLRVAGYWVPPYTEVKLTHRISVNTPVTVYFGDGKEQAKLVEVDGDRLIMLDGPRRVVGPGEALNITDDSLTIEGYLTETDQKYLEACSKLGLHNYMASFVEGYEDLATILAIDNKAAVIAKIESRKGLGFVESQWKDTPRLMAARGDLYNEMKMPHQITKAVEMIVRKDPNAVVASRLFDSLGEGLEPSCADIGDVDSLMRMGYRHFMFGDQVCMQRDSIISALNLFEAMASQYLGGVK